MCEYTDCPKPWLLVCSLLPIVWLLFEAAIQDGVSLRKYIHVCYSLIATSIPSPYSMGETLQSNEREKGGV